MTWPAVPQLIATVVLALIMSASHYLDANPTEHMKTVSHHGQPETAGLSSRYGAGAWQAETATDIDPGGN